MTSLRDATSSDTEPLIEMMRGLWTTPTSTFNEAMSRKCLATMLADPGLGRVYLINDGEGYAVIVFGFSLEFGRDAFIDELFIKPEYRGQGIGSAVLDLLSAQSEELGVQALHLEVADANDRAELLYARKSFKRHNRRLMTRWLTSEVPAN